MRELILIFFLLPNLLDINAKNVKVDNLSDILNNLTAEYCRFIIKSNIDLEGNIIEFAPNCSLVIRNGSLSNGVLIGRDTKLQFSGNQIFTNCIIKGDWRAKYSCSSMFDDDMETMLLLHNMSSLSSVLKLDSSREYIILAKDDKIQADVIEGVGHEKPIIKFHTENPNIPGINIIGNNIRLKNLIIEDDYDIINDEIYGANNSFIGNTITIIAPHDYVQSLTIEGCEFRGGTSSSFVASSQVKNCSIVDTKISGYIADHAVYCSMNVETYSVEHCVINNVTHGNGLFKVRTSKHLRCFKMRDVYAKNFNGYMVEVALQNTPLADLTFNKITVTKDKDNESVFYGFCIVDETRTMAGSSGGFNANNLVFNNCKFDYGYNNHAFVYQGSAKMACVKSISYINVEANGSHFGGGNSNSITVKDCIFSNFYDSHGIDIQANSLFIKNSILSEEDNVRDANCLFLVNYYDSQLKKISLEGVNANLNAKHLVNVIKGEKVDLSIKDCNITLLSADLYSAPKQSKICISQKRSSIGKKY